MSERRQDPERYKKTELGVIPEDWKIVSVKEIGDVKGGKRLPKGHPFTSGKTKYPYLRIVDFKNGTIDKSNLKYISLDDYEIIKQYTISYNDVYISIAGTIGLVGKIPKEFDGANLTENAAKIVIMDKGQLDNYYLQLFLTSPFGQYQIESKTMKSAQPKLALARIKEINILLPPLQEQQKIASIISKVDEQIEQTEWVIDKTELLKKGLMQKLLAKGIGHTKFKKTELGEIPEEWGIFQIDQLTNINRESRDPTKNSEELFNYIDIDAVENGTGLIKNPKRLFGREAPSRARRVIHKDDVIMSTVRPYHKAFSLVTHLYDNQICSTGFAVLSCGKNVYPKYLLQYLFSDQVIDQCTSMMAGGQYPALNTTQVSKIKIAIPPLAEQQKIASILSKVDSQVQDNQSYLTKLQELKKGLMQDLLTGKVIVCA